jgi:hypothetical protein
VQVPAAADGDAVRAGDPAAEPPRVVVAGGVDDDLSAAPPRRPPHGHADDLFDRHGDGCGWQRPVVAVGLAEIPLELLADLGRQVDGDVGAV